MRGGMQRLRTLSGLDTYVYISVHIVYIYIYGGSFVIVRYKGGGGDQGYVI